MYLFLFFFINIPRHKLTYSSALARVSQPLWFSQEQNQEVLVSVKCKEWPQIMFWYCLGHVYSTRTHTPKQSQEYQQVTVSRD